MRTYKSFISEEESKMKFYEQSMVTGNPIKVKPNLELHFGFTVNTNIFDCQTLEREVRGLLANLDLVLISNTRREFFESGGTPMESTELIFVDRDSSKNTLKF